MIILLGRKLVREVILDFPKGDRYKVPSSLFSCQMLTKLELHNSVLSLPSQAKGFTSLIELYLRKVTLRNGTIENLLFHSPLQKLTMVKCDGFTRLNICAPTLKRIHIDSSCEYVQFLNTPKLSFAHIALITIAGRGPPPSDLVMVGLRMVEGFSMCNHFLQILAASTGLETELLIYPNLKTLGFIINLAMTREISTALHLIRCSPHLRIMVVRSYPTEEGINICQNEVWSGRLHPNEIIFPELETVYFRRFRGGLRELDFIKFILMNAKMLDRLNITWDKTVPMVLDREHIYKSLMLFPRASPTAGVQFIC